MFQRPLVVLQPQWHPETVAGAGVALARACRAEVALFLVAMPEVRVPAGLPFDEGFAAIAPPERDLQQCSALHAMAQRTALAAGLQAQAVEASESDPLQAILSAAKSHRCDAIVVASDGSNAVIRMIKGSLVPRLVTASPLPVLVCSMMVSMRLADPAGASRRLMVTLEDDDEHGVALARGMSLARQLGAELLLVQVMPSGAVPVVELTGFVGSAHERLSAEIEAQSRRKLTAATAMATKAGLRAQGISLPAGTAAKDIARLASEHACELIVVAQSGSNALLRLITGSQIPGLVTSATVPLLICPDVEDPTRWRSPRRRVHRQRASAAAAAARAAQDRDR